MHQTDQLGFTGIAPTVQTIERGATFSPCRTWRYELWRIWDRSRPIDLWTLINPSTADEKADDPTVQSMMRRSRHLGRGGFYLVNLFAFCSSTPEALLTTKDPIGPENDDRIAKRSADLAKTGGKIIVAWGSSLSFRDGKAPLTVRDRDAAVLRLFAAIDEVLCIGRSGPGDASPTHPLARGKHRVPEDAPLLVFVPGAKQGREAPTQKVKPKPFSVLPPSDRDRPPLGSSPTGPCVWCEAPADGRYGVTVDQKTRPLCNLCGQSASPTVAEIRAKIRGKYGSLGRCGACGTEGPRGECQECGGTVQ